MEFHENTIFHIYNQGNNRQKIFFNDDNYRYFKRKLAFYMKPFGELLAYCLMPNHFHVLFFVRESAVKRRNGNKRTLNDAIGVMLRSYTTAINKQEGRSGSLFRKNTKARDGSEEDAITLNGKNKGIFFNSNMDYAFFCFKYIHENPVKPKLTNKPEEWMYSSAREFAGLEENPICNIDLAKQLGLV